MIEFDFLYESKHNWFVSKTLIISKYLYKKFDTFRNLNNLIMQYIIKTLFCFLSS